MKHGTALTPDLLADSLNASPDQRIRDLGTQLFPFTSGGEYGRFFAGGNSMAFSGRLTVLELEELKGRKHLQQVVLLQLIYQIQQDMYLGERDRQADAVYGIPGPVPRRQRRQVLQDHG